MNIVSVHLVFVRCLRQNTCELSIIVEESCQIFKSSTLLFFLLFFKAPAAEYIYIYISYITVTPGACRSGLERRSVPRCTTNCPYRRGLQRPSAYHQLFLTPWPAEAASPRCTTSCPLQACLSRISDLATVVRRGCGPRRTTNCPWHLGRPEATRWTMTSQHPNYI